MYTSFHFCGVFCPVVCGCRVHPFCILVGGHRLSRAPSSAAGPPPADMSRVSHPVPNGNVFLCGIHLGRTETLASFTGRGNCIWKWLCLHPKAQQEKSPIRQRADSLLLIFRLLSLAGSYRLPISSLSGALGPFAEPPQSSVVLGGKQPVNLKRGIDIGWLFSFTGKFWKHLSHLLILVPDTPKEMMAALFECKVASSYTWPKG